jgi:hypothetical protein
LACPYFVPREIVYDLSWPHPARLPLGAGWTGTCCAASYEFTSGAVTPNMADSNIADSSIADSNLAESSIADSPTSGAASGLSIDSAIIRDCCNLGYATACPHLPVSRDWDAIRFTVASSAPNQITLCYVCELAHAPKAHGTLTYDLTSEVWQDTAKASMPGARAIDAPAKAAASGGAAATAVDARVRRLAASYLQAYRVRQCAGQSLSQVVGQSDGESVVPSVDQNIGQSVEHSSEQTGAPA